MVDSVTEKDNGSGSLLSDLEGVKCPYRFLPGCPGAETLKDCTSILRKAAQDVLTEDADVEDLFSYGDTGGDTACLEELAKFLSVEYGEVVCRDSLMLTVAATQGLHMVLTTLFFQQNPIFVEDPSYFFGHKMITEDLKREAIPVPFDEDGIIPEELDRLLTLHRPQAGTDIDKRSYWAAVYMVPVFHNPSGITYSPERCSALVRLAHKHDVLLLTEDIYNLIYFGDSPTRRMLSFDKQMMSEQGQDKGHVLSLGTFSKILAPSLRFGWIEGPKNVLAVLNGSNYGNGGGSFHHFLSKLMTSILKSGVMHSHVTWLRQVYKRRMSILVEVLTSDLPEGCSFVTPKGGFFIWLQLRKETDTSKFLEFALDKAGVNFMPGVHCSPSGGSCHCCRLSISVIDENTVREGARKLCEVYKQFLAQE